MSKQDVVIGGYAETPIRLRTGRSAYDLAGEALADLLVRYGLEKGQIDGLSVTTALSEASNPFFAVYMAEALGLTPRWLNQGGLGGCSAVSGVARAMSAIRDGQCDCVVVLSADAPSSKWQVSYGMYRPEFQEVAGVVGPPATFGLLMSRYEHEYGLDPEALAKIAITQRAHAVLNDNTVDKLRKPLDRDAYFRSPIIAAPLRVLDSVMFCDGANAVIVASEGRAQELGLSNLIHPTAYAEITNIGADDPLTGALRTGTEIIADRLWTQAGKRPSDIQSFHPYDDFTIAVMMQMEAFGFCDIGAGSEFVMATDLGFDGTLPLNTGGGQISAGQPGLAGGGLNLVEAVRQLSGDGGARQVSRRDNALVTGIGVIPFGRNWASSVAMILET